MLEYEAPPTPSRTIEDVSNEFAQGVLVSQFLVFAGWMLVSRSLPDSLLAGAGVLIGMPLLAAAVGVAPFAIAIGVRVGLLGDRVSLASKRAVHAWAFAYAFQMIAVAFALRFLAPRSPGFAILALAPVVPLLAPLWLVRKMR